MLSVENTADLYIKQLFLFNSSKQMLPVVKNSTGFFTHALIYVRCMYVCT